MLNHIHGIIQKEFLNTVCRNEPAIVCLINNLFLSALRVQKYLIEKTAIDIQLNQKLSLNNDLDECVGTPTTVGAKKSNAFLG